ncbi:putative DNA-binding transcriptional regulator [Citrobacter freundii]|nr:putative DNA-binding transcriptional regulator [Citrobacter freundii]
MSVFAKVVELGSFTAAARQLQMSVSSISQTVSKLEDELQVKLLKPQYTQHWANRSR